MPTMSQRILRPRLLKNIESTKPQQPALQIAAADRKSSMQVLREKPGDDCHKTYCELFAVHGAVCDQGIVNRYECAHPSGAISGMKARARSVTRSTSGDLKIRVKLNIASTATSTEAFSTLIHPGTSILSHARHWSMGSDRRTTVAVMDWLDKALLIFPPIIGRRCRKY